MIGGRVLDLSALLAVADQTSVYASALVWTAVGEDMVLLVPSTAAGLVWARAALTAHPVLEVLFGLPITVVDELGTTRGRELGELLRSHDIRLDLAHAAVCSLHRDWPLVTAEPARYGELRGTLILEPLP